LSAAEFDDPLGEDFMLVDGRLYYPSGYTSGDAPYGAFVDEPWPEANVSSDDDSWRYDGPWLDDEPEPDDMPWPDAKLRPGDELWPQASTPSRCATASVRRVDDTDRAGTCAAQAIPPPQTPESGAHPRYTQPTSKDQISRGR
jgi:hypothetical protein